MDPITHAMFMGSGAKKPPVKYVAHVMENNSSSANQSLTLTGIQKGDVIIGMISNENLNPPPTSQDYYTITTSTGSIQSFFTNYRSMRLQYKIADGSSETMSWTGHNGLMVAYRNFTEIGQFANFGNNVSSSVTGVSVPALSNLDTSGRGTLIGLSYATDVATSIESPYTLQYNTWGEITNNIDSSVPSRIMSFNGNVVPCTITAEIL